MIRLTGTRYLTNHGASANNELLLLSCGSLIYCVRLLVPALILELISGAGQDNGGVQTGGRRIQ